MLFRYRFVRGTDAPPDEGWREVDPACARFDVHDALRDPFVRFDFVQHAAVDHFDSEVDRVLALLRSGRARLLKRPTPRPHVDVDVGASTNREDGSDAPLLSELAPPESSEANADPPAVPARPTWIEINVVDGDDAPIHDHRFRLRLSDGSIREGKLAADGRIRFDDVVAGLCTLILPTNDESEWDPANAP